MAKHHRLSHRLTKGSTNMAEAEAAQWQWQLDAHRIALAFGPGTMATFEPLTDEQYAEMRARGRMALARSFETDRPSSVEYVHETIPAIGND